MTKSSKRKFNWNELIATFFYLGKSPWMPGTFGSIGAAFVLLVFSLWPLTRHFWFLLFSTVAIFILGLLTAGNLAKEKGAHDPQEVVIDEVLGMFSAVLGLPLGVHSITLGFVFFRIFDTLKPYPIRKLEAFKGGWGIMLDDLAAGICANLLVRLISRITGIF